MVAVRELKVLDVGNSMPDYIKRLPVNFQMSWQSAYNQAADLFGFDEALMVANRFIIKKIQEQQQKKDIDPTPELVQIAAERAGLVETDIVDATPLLEEPEEELVSMALLPAQEMMVSCADNGDIVLNAVLADETFNTDGKRFSKDALKSMAEKINKKGMFMPDIEHEEFKALREELGDNYDAIKAAMKDKKGILTKVKAFYNKGKLFITAWLDKRYKKHTEVYDKLSIEARGLIGNDKNVYADADPLSFTFTNTPKIAGARVLSVN